MNIIYQPKGRAKEYSEWAVNLYKGCNHGCVYCYAPSAVFKKKNIFHNDVKPRKNIIEKLRKDAEKHPGNGRKVLLSFTSDAYQKIDEELQLTRKAIKILKKNGYKIVILSKAGKAIERDFDLLDKDDFVGATLTCTNNKDSLEWEPEGALPNERMEVLKNAKEHGIQTWASLEPVIFPEQTLEIIDITHEYIDLFKVGKLNYHAKAKEVDWREFTKKVMIKLEHYGKSYYIKKDLKEYIDKPA